MTTAVPYGQQKTHQACSERLTVTDDAQPTACFLPAESQLFSQTHALFAPERQNILGISTYHNSEKHWNIQHHVVHEAHIVSHKTG